MGQTITEKILSKACGHTAKPGDIVVGKVDRLMTMDVSAALVLEQFEKTGAERMVDDEMLVVSFDHVGCGHNLKDAETLKRAREFMRKYKIKNFYDIGRNGICHQIMMEEGFVQPGKVILGTDSHSTSYGAFGAAACGVTQSEGGVILATGEHWFLVPETIRVILTGERPAGVYGKDIALKIVNLLGYDKEASYKAVEVVGPGLKSLDMSDRICICNMIAETGAKFGVIPGDEITDAYLKDIAKAPYEKVESDDDAVYEKTYEIDLNAMEPTVAAPHSMENTHFAKDIKDAVVDHVFIGSCTNGRLEDMEQAAKILAGRKVADNLRMIIVPASRKVYMDALKAGYIQTFIEAGALVEGPSCGACMGLHTGVLAAGEVARGGDEHHQPQF